MKKNECVPEMSIGNTREMLEEGLEVQVMYEVGRGLIKMSIEGDSISASFCRTKTNWRHFGPPINLGVDSLYIHLENFPDDIIINERCNRSADNSSNVNDGRRDKRS
jgi:hypothetical protein